MLINNIFFNNNQYKNNKLPVRSTHQNQQFFTGKAERISKEIQLTPEDLQKVSFIADKYEQILKIFSSFNGIYQQKFKSLYPNIVSGEKIKGFVFESIAGLKNKHLQIVRFNTKANSDELLTLSLLDSQNKNLLRYRINKNGRVCITSEKENLNQLSINPFNNEVQYSNYLNSFIEEIKNFSFYSKNFKTINKNSSNTSPQKVIENIDKLKNVQSSTGIKPEIDKIVQNYSELTNVLNLNRGKDTLELKQAYFKNVNPKTKGLVINDSKNTQSITYCPLMSKEDNRVAKIVIHNKNKALENIFVLFSDGRIAKQKKLSEETNAFRPNNLEYISDNDIQNFKIKNIFESLNKEFEEFKKFIIETRNSKTDAKNKIIQDKKLQQEKLQEEKLLKKLEKEQIKQEKLALKAQKELIAKESARKKQEEKIKKLAEKNAKIAAEKLIKEQKQIQKAENKKTQIKETTTKNTAQIQEKTKQQKVQHEIKFPSYNAMRLNKITEELNQIFNLPVEKRSPHLTHEKLSNGTIFAGRFSLTTLDNANITVSRIKSPKYVDFTYYSIKVKKDGKEFIFNIDPDTSKILKSKDGKPEINKRNIVTYISKEDYLKDNPEASNLPEYLNEICEYKTSAPRKIIKHNTKPQKQIFLEQQEQEVLKALMDSENLLD